MKFAEGRVAITLRALQWVDYAVLELLIARIARLMGTLRAWLVASQEVQSVICMVRAFAPPSKIRSVNFINKLAACSPFTALNNELRATQLSAECPDPMVLFGSKEIQTFPIRFKMHSREAVFACAVTLPITNTRRNLL